LLYLFNKKKNNVVIFTGHKLIGNIETLINSENIKYNKYYLTFSLKDYISLSKKKNNILLALNPFHLFILLKSKLIISSHGLVLHRLLKKYFNLKTISTGHAIKSNNNSEILKELYHFDEVWLFSNFEKKIYIEECNYKIQNLEVTGFPRIDGLSDLYLKKDEIKRAYGFNDQDKLILYAPTDDRKNQEYLNSIFSLQNLNLYKFFDEISDKLNLKFILKYHINTNLNGEIIQYINKSKNLKRLENANNYPDISSLAISDILITDWSSIFVDSLAISIPIIFLNTPRAYIESGVSKVFNNQLIERKNNYEEISKDLSKLIDDNFLFNKNLKELKKIIYEDTYENNNIARCVERIESII
tara:strand:- start:1298 stop:2371 length:1074 start_codon:yes stop_codon:yes gene_type:complete